jgi:hypothetical protein
MLGGDFLPDMLFYYSETKVLNWGFYNKSIIGGMKCQSKVIASLYFLPGR